MLKALELAGFKSFADKTRFEFPPGITVIVGPNGSGKSNIVDAIKWVLGEQSAKSLRGKDMADVIFKGGGGGRRMLNTAEATIIFDNSEGLLPVDAPEVHVSRRVYRSGEGEYLINGEPCRLKDVKDLFRGTGVGTDAYSLIEQGKVDRMLQASPKDRRAMFEEAAGISRFKAKKLEAQRRLERVDQNLVRLADIVDEVESRLRSVRNQASKARRYREYSERLQQLRTQVGLTDWRRLSGNLAEIEAELATLVEESEQLTASTELHEARTLELDVEISTAIEEIRTCENRGSRTREQIGVRESSVEQAYARGRDLEDGARRYRSQLAAMTGRVGDLQARLAETAQQLAVAENADTGIRQRLEHHQQALDGHSAKLDELRAKNEARRSEYADGMRQMGDLSSTITNHESQLKSLDETEQQTEQQLGTIQATVSTSLKEFEQLTGEEQQLAQRTSSLQERQSAARKNLATLQIELNESREQLVLRQRQFSAVNERADVLEELEQNQEGLSLGVRDVLDLARESNSGPFSEVQGLVADLVQVGVDVAPLVDVALGDKAQHVVLGGTGLLEEIESARFEPAGRVGFFVLDDDSSEEPDDDLNDQPSVVGRMDRLVTYAPRMETLAHRLLGKTWLVETLSVALALHRTRGRNARFVTISGELVESDGTVTVGQRATSAGLVSRRSQLRALTLEAEELREQIAGLESDTAQLGASLTKQTETVEQLAQELQEANNSLSELRVRVRTLQERCDQLKRQQSTLSDELSATRQRRDTIRADLERVRGERSKLETTLSNTEAAIAETDGALRKLDGEREEHALGVTAAKVELSKSQETVDNLRARVSQFEEDQRERAHAIRDAASQLETCVQRGSETTREILRINAELAELYLDKESLESEAAQQIALRDSLTQQKAELGSEVQKLRRRAQKLDDRQHQQELAAGEVKHQRSTLADRLREDYGIEISDLEQAESAEEQQQRDEVEQEINDLRRKINNIGAVNVDALEELDDLETRFGALSGQYQDLVQAKESLERIISRINADSRRLFQETLEIIRANFQTLYRKSFGGGRADIVIEEGADPLEAGVDIIATPPGKPSFNNSLLSGGEKALTAVALLLGIFEYRPSPFCVLDEVDAPFDEANIGRFIDVLKGFLGWTRFVIVTHSKKTMTAATTLYGVTMQESGVSKQVSVRFEDVSDDGEISQDAIDREGNSDDDEQAA